MMIDLIDRQAAIDAITALDEYENIDISTNEVRELLRDLPSAEPVIRCKDCKHNPKDEWFGCPMSHLSEAQRPETAWCWKGERRTDAETEV